MQLEQSRLWKTEVEPGDIIAVESGGLWLTFNGQDVVLQAGQTWSASQSGEILAQSLGGVVHFNHLSQSAALRQGTTHRAVRTTLWTRLFAMFSPHLKSHA